MKTESSIKRAIQPVVHIHRLGEEPSDYSYWQTQSTDARMEALEQIRNEFHGWTNETRPRLQRVLTLKR